MLNFKTWIVNTIKNDSQMQTLLAGPNSTVNVFPVDIDITPELFPCIIIQDAGVSVLSRPQGMHVGNMQLDIYSLTNAQDLETIYDRLAQLFNFRDSTNAAQHPTGTLWWIREAMVRDSHEQNRRLWRKLVTLKFWYSKTDFT